MNSKKIFFVVAAALLTFTLTSCEDLLSSLFGVSIEDRIIAFENTLNTAERTDILDHIHPDMKNRDQLNDETVIDVSPLGYANHDFDIGAPVVNDANVATCSYTDGNDTVGTIVFAMDSDGYDYKILKLTLTLDANPDDPFELKRLLAR
jgi:hypothetical protein